MKESRWWAVNVGSALRVLGGNPVDGLPPARHTEPRWIGLAGHQRTSMNFVVAFVFLVSFHIMVISFVLLTLKILY